jgi:hypothetical protein
MHLDELEARDTQYRAFGSIIRTYARDYDDERILTMLAPLLSPAYQPATTGLTSSPHAMARRGENAPPSHDPT